MAKYRQPGYQDRDWESKHQEPRGEGKRKPPPERTSGPPRWDHALGPKPVNLPGTRAVSRCAQCGTVLDGTAALGQCPKCGFELHSCKQCMYFDTGAQFECTQPIPERIAKKDARNNCTFYAFRTTVEKDTAPTTASPQPSAPSSNGGYSRPNDARKAFDDLFKK